MVMVPFWADAIRVLKRNIGKRRSNLLLKHMMVSGNGSLPKGAPSHRKKERFFRERQKRHRQRHFASKLSLAG
jgi:hypothetical protein